MRTVLCAIVLLTTSIALAETPQEKREWLLARLIVDMQKQGVYSGEKYSEVEEKIASMSDSQVNVLVHYYRETRKQAEAARKEQQRAAASEARAKLEEAQAYRDQLRQQVAEATSAAEQQYEQNAAEIRQYANQTLGMYGSVVTGPVVYGAPVYVARPVQVAPVYPVCWGHPHHHLHPVGPIYPVHRVHP